MKIFLSSLLLPAAALLHMPALAQPAEDAVLSGASENDAQADDDEQGRDGGSRQRPRSSKANADARGSAPAEAAARGAAVNAARSRGDAGFRPFAGELAGSSGADLRGIEAKGDEAAKLARMRAAGAADDARDAARITRGARTARGVGGAATGAAIGALAVLPTVIEITTGADIGLERYVFEGGTAIVTGDRAAMAAANEELGQRAVHVGESIAATAQDPARIGRNVEQAGSELAQTGADVGAAAAKAVSNPAKVGRDAAKAACSVGSFFTGGNC